MFRPRNVALPGPILIEDDDTPIDLDLIQQENEEHLFAEISKIIDLTDELIVETRAEIKEPLLRTQDSYLYPDGTVVYPGTTLQLNSQYSPCHLADRDKLHLFKRDFFKAEFFKIEKITHPEVGQGTEPTFWGYVYSRARNVEGKFAKKLNEVVLIANVDSQDPRPWRQQALVDFKPSMLRRIRELRVTNADYPEFKYDAAKLRRERLNRPRFVEEHGPLVCRHQYIRYFNGPRKKSENKPHQWAILRVGEGDVADPKYKKTNESLTRAWRGGRRLGGSYVPGQHYGRSESNGLYPGQRYTTADFFAGAGGVSRGMTMAGAHLDFAVDNWKPAADSLRANFAPGTKVYHSDVSEFITGQDINHHVDILHLSPPCQVWSPAHTVPGRNDEINEAILFSCGPVLRKLKPRLFTLEQTFGILHDRFSQYFSRLMADFTECGYSTRWAVLNLATFGVPQPRKRLIILGAGPGESLPDFPKPTHSLDGRTRPGFKPLVTVRQALEPLCNNVHSGIDHQPVPLRIPKPPWDPDRILNNTITCNGGRDNYHWDGTREFTIAEFALLQGFPLEHIFVGSKTDKKRQIGNAFPPKVVKTFYEHLIGWLDQTDGIRNRPKGLPPPGAVVYDLEIEDLASGGIKSIGSGSSLDDPMEID